MGVSECMVIVPYASEMSAEHRYPIVRAINVSCYLNACMSTEFCFVLRVYLPARKTTCI